MSNETILVLHSKIKEIYLINSILSAGIFNKMHMVFVKTIWSIRLNNAFC